MSHKPLPWQSALKQNRIDECDATNKETRKGHLPVERTVEIKEKIGNMEIGNMTITMMNSTEKKTQRLVATFSKLLLKYFWSKKIWMKIRHED